jgi:hypothetical protein
MNVTEMLLKKKIRKLCRVSKLSTIFASALNKRNHITSQCGQTNIKTESRPSCDCPRWKLKALRHYATSRKVAGSNPDIISFLN